MFRRRPLLNQAQLSLKVVDSLVFLTSVVLNAKTFPAALINVISLARVQALEDLHFVSLH